MFFYYSKTLTGRWTPVKAADRPTTSAEHRKVRTSPVVELVKDHHTLSLDELSGLYPLESLVKEEDTSDEA